MKKSSARALLVLMVLIWGLSWPINKVGLAFTSSTNYIELRFVIGTIAMFVIALAKKSLRLPSQKDLPIIFTVGIFQMALMMNLANYGLSLTSPGKATFLAFTVSIWIIPLTFLVNRKSRLREVLSFVIGIVGIFVLTKAWDFRNNVEWKGTLLLLLAAFSWAVGILCARHMTWHRSSLQLLPWQLLLATICTIGIACYQNIPFLPNTANPVFIGSLLYTGILGIAIGYWALIAVSKHLAPSMISLGLLFVPISAMCISVAFLHESLSWSVIGGVTLLIFASLIHIYSEKKQPEL